MGFFDKLFKKDKQAVKQQVEEQQVEEQQVEEQQVEEQQEEQEQGLFEDVKEIIAPITEPTYQMVEPTKEILEEIKEVQEQEVEKVEKVQEQEIQEVEKVQEQEIEEVEKVQEQEIEEVEEVQEVEEVEEVQEQEVEEVEEVQEQEVEEVEEVQEQEVEELEKVQEQEVEEVQEQEIEEIKEEAKVIENQKKKGFFNTLISGLAKTRDNILGSVEDVLKGFKKIDEELYEELEEVLIMADFGVETTLYIMDELRKMVKERKITEPGVLKETLGEIIANILTKQEVTPLLDETRPNVVLVIGVNGAGKTTSIGKLSKQLKDDKKKVVVAAADTFRAAAIEQLNIWTDRAGVEIIKHHEGADPASVIFDGIQAAKARKADVLICDTAGRLQNKTNLMKELEKISRIIDREYPQANKQVLIVLDATTGQNAISQVKLFKEVAKVDGIILTKLDGTAKGGAIVGICQTMNIPVKYIGVGEKIEDLQPFDPEDFAKALFVNQMN